MSAYPYRDPKADRRKTTRHRRRADGRIPRAPDLHGKLYLCLGQDDSADLQAPLLASPHVDEPVARALVDAIARKPKGHDFVIVRARLATVRRHMSVTGG